MNETLCDCLNEPLLFDQYTVIRHIGIDETNGRYGEVDLWQCKTCGRYWLHYLVEYEAFTDSGRYFMGLINKEIAVTLAPDEAVDYLDTLEWHLFGGSYFNGKGKSSNEINADL